MLPNELSQPTGDNAALKAELRVFRAFFLGIPGLLAQAIQNISTER
jgi:hypothetical protein